MNRQTDNEIIYRAQGGQSMRGIARDLRVSRWRVKRVIQQQQAAREDPAAGPVNSQLPQPVVSRSSKLDAFKTASAIAAAGRKICWFIKPACLLSMWVTTIEYLRVVNTVAALTSTNQQSFATTATTRGVQLEETLTRWGVNPQAWLAQLEQLDKRCTRALGAAHRMDQRAAEVAQRWL